MDLRRVDLNLLLSLDALLRERSVTRAAERLSVSQPAMSSTLARLRRLFDDPLLVRSGNTLLPTPFAESLSDRLPHVLAQIDELVNRQPSFDPTTDTRVFTVAASDYITLLVLRPLVARLAADAPGVRLHVEPVNRDYPQQLREDRLDLLFLPQEVIVPMHGLSSQAVFLDRFVCAVSVDHPEVGASVSIEQLQTLPYLAYRAHGLSSNVDRQLDELGVSRAVEMTTEHFVIAPLLLSGTNMICMLHERLGIELERSAGIRLLEPPVVLRPVTQAIFWHPRRDVDPGHRWLRDRVTEITSGFLQP